MKKTIFVCAAMASVVLLSGAARAQGKSQTVDIATVYRRCLPAIVRPRLSVAAC